MRGYMVMVYGLENPPNWEPAWLTPFSRKRDAEKRCREMRKEHGRPGTRWAVAKIEIPEDGEQS